MVEPKGLGGQKQERVKDYPESHFKDTGIPNLSSKHPETEHWCHHFQPIAEVEVGGSPSKHCPTHRGFGQPCSNITSPSTACKYLHPVYAKASQGLSFHE